MIRIKRALLMTTVSLICAITLCMQGNYAQAQELGDGTSFEFAIVVAGQSAGSISSTAATPFDFTNVGILSIGNQTISASLEMTSEQTGFWWIALIGIGPQVGVDFSFGLAPFLGRPAQIAVPSPLGFALATGGVSSLDTVSEEEPITYNINLSGG